MSGYWISIEEDEAYREMKEEEAKQERKKRLEEARIRMIERERKKNNES